jgi:ubiquinone biosynthesis protein COQ4
MSTSRFLNSPLFVHAFTRMSLRRHGDDVATTYDIPDMSRGLADVADHASALEGLEEEKAKNPALRDFLARRPSTIYNPDAMEHYERGTLGAEIRDFMRKTGYDLHFINKETTPANDLEYLLKRFGDSHEIQHMVTGFGPNSAGENALVLMNVTANARHFNPEFAQFLSMPNIFVTAASYARIGFNYPAGTMLQLEATERGIAAGRAIKMPPMLVEWENYLDWQLSDIAADLGFERGPGAAWMISEELSRG